MENNGGLLDFIKSPEGQGLLATVFGGLAGAQRGQPLNNIGRAGMSGITGYGSALDRQMTLDNNLQNKRLTDSHIANWNSEVDQRKFTQDALLKKQSRTPNMFIGGSPAVPSSIGDPANGIPPSAGSPATPQTLDWQSALNAGYTPDEITKLAAMPNVNRPEVARTIDTMDSKGLPVSQQLDKYGNAVGSNSPQWKAPVSVDQGDKKTFVDPSTLMPKGSFRVNQTPDSLASHPEFGAISNLRGDDLLTSLPPQEAAQIKALAEGRMAFPAGFALKSPYWQDKITKVAQYDPNFDAVNYNARSQTRNDFAKGKSADNLTAINTAIQHLGKLNDAYDKLGNSDYPSYNNISNWLGNAMGNKDIQGNYAAVSTDSTAVAHELAKVFRQTGMSEAEIKDWQSKISTSAAPAQSKQVIQSAIDLMEGRLQSLGARYNQGMGTTEQPLNLLTPEARQTLNRLNPSASDGAPNDYQSAAAAELKRRGK